MRDASRYSPQTMSNATRETPEFKLLAQGLAAYESKPAQVRRAVANLTREQLNTPAAPGSWSIMQLVVHLLDSDMAATHRMRRMAAEELPLLIAYDHDAFMTKLDFAHTDLAETLDLFELNRKFTARWLRTLDVDTMTRAGVHSARGLITLNDVLEMYSWHVDHHLAFVPGKRASLGAAPAPAQ